MISQARKQARETGCRAILLYGAPYYCSPRHGFVPAETPGLRTARNMSAEELRACKLLEDALPA